MYSPFEGSYGSLPVNVEIVGNGPHVYTAERA